MSSRQTLISVVLLLVLSTASSCSLFRNSGGAVEELPPVERLRNTGSFTVEIDQGSGQEGEYSVPLVDGPFPAVVLANDGSLPADQVKEEARLLARHGFGVLSVTLAEENPLRQLARAGASAVTQPGISTSEAALVLLAGDPLPALEAHQRLSGFRVLILVDPGPAPSLENFVELGAPLVILLREETDPSVSSSWRDAISLLGARAEIVTLPEEEALTGLLSPNHRFALVRLIIEYLQ